jgi:hypothetical protein
MGSIVLKGMQGLYCQARLNKAFSLAGSVAEVFATKPRACAKWTSSQPSIRVKSSRG